jgi:hypothetical protein
MELWLIQDHEQLPLGLLKLLLGFNCRERQRKSVRDNGGKGKGGGSVWVQNTHDIGHYL